MGSVKELKVQKRLAWLEKKLGIGVQCSGRITWGAKTLTKQRADLIHLRDGRKETKEEKERAKEKGQTSNDDGFKEFKEFKEGRSPQV